MHDSSPQPELAPPEEELEYFPLRQYWPERDSLITAFRYKMAAGLCAEKRVLEIGCGELSCIPNSALFLWDKTAVARRLTVLLVLVISFW